MTLCTESVSKDKKNDLEIIQKSTSFLKTWVGNNYKLQLSCNDLARAIIVIICVMLHLCDSYILCTGWVKEIMCPNSLNGKLILIYYFSSLTTVYV